MVQLVMEEKNYAYNEKFFGQWLRKARKERRVTNAELMKVLGTNNDSIIRWSTGDYPKGKDGRKDTTKPREPIEPMKADKMILLCNHYGLDISSFFLENGEAAKLTTKRVKSGTRHGEDMDILRLKLEMMEEKNGLLQDINELRKRLDAANDQIAQLQAQLAEARKPGAERHGLSDEKGATASGRITVEP